MIDPGFGVEHDFAVAVMNGAPPQTVFNVLYAAFRLSTTDADVRDGRLTYRDPAVWLSPSMCERVVGTRVISDRGLIGCLCIGFVKDDELWGVAKLYYQNTALHRFTPELNIIDGEQTETSDIIIEGKPRLLDYLALIIKEPTL